MKSQAKLRVLLVEDEPMIAMTAEDAIEALGFATVGPVAHLADALELAAKGDFDCAILDINIRGGTTYSVADLLRARGCPFFFATGYSAWSIPEHLVNEKRLTKPFTSSALEAELGLLHDRVRLKAKAG